jgi:hypothetical protein
VLFDQPQGIYHVVCVAKEETVVAHLVSWTGGFGRGAGGLGKSRVERRCFGENREQAMAQLYCALQTEIAEALSVRIPWSAAAKVCGGDTGGNVTERSEERAAMSGWDMLFPY